MAMNDEGPLQLYTREVSLKGKVSYKPFPPTGDICLELDNGEVVTLLTTLYMCVVLSVVKFLPAHSRITRLTKDCEKALLRLSQGNRAPLDEHLINVGETGFDAYVKAVVQGVENGRKK